MTIAYLNTKIGKFDNKIPNVSGLFKNKTKQTNKQTNKKDYDTKRKDIEVKYFTTADYNKFTSDILEAKIKQQELVNKSDIADFVKKDRI